MAVVGVDACRGGWVAVVLDGRTSPRGLFVAEIEELEDLVPEADGFGVDIPIGLPTDGPRTADELAREFVGPRRNSVFHTPVRAALLASTHAEASAVSKQVTGHGVSQQAYALRTKIFETEAWLTEAPVPVWEVHPEVSFTLLLGHPPTASKKKWAGMLERLSGLEGVGIELGDLGEAGRRVPVDDALDAAVAAWSTERILRGVARSFPDSPERDQATARAIAIWA